jgi:hypothetical protein
MKMVLMEIYQTCSFGHFVQGLYISAVIDKKTNDVIIRVVMYLAKNRQIIFV